MANPSRLLAARAASRFASWIVIASSVAIVPFTGCTQGSSPPPERPPEIEDPGRNVPDPTPTPVSGDRKAFERAGLVPPATTAPTGTPEAAALRRLRDAVGDARALSEKELAGLQGGEDAVDSAGEPSARRNFRRSPTLSPGGGPVTEDAAPRDPAGVEDLSIDLGGGTEPSADFSVGGEVADDENPPAVVQFFGGPSGRPARAPTPLPSDEATGGMSFSEDAEGEEDLDEGEDSGSILRTTPQLLRSPKETPRLGKILFQNEEGKYESLVPRALRVQVFVEGPRARTVVDYVFSNPHDRALEGTFYYPLPADASPAAFAMYEASVPVEEKLFDEGQLLPPPVATVPTDFLDAGHLASIAPRRAPETVGTTEARYLVPDWGRLQLAHVVEPRRARETYEVIVRRNIDPALLEWSGAGTFKARVFPIGARAVKRVILAYEETLPVTGDLLRFGFPLPEDNGLGEVDVRLYIDEAHGRVRSVEGIDLATVPSTAAGKWTRFDLRYPATPDRAVDIAIEPGSEGADREAASRFQALVGFSTSGLEGVTLFARIRPPVPDRELSTPTGRALFVVDTSLSEDGLRHGLSVELLKEILEKDTGIDEYAVLLFDVRPRWLHADTWRRNDADSRGETMAELSKVFLEGATNLAAALSELDRQADWLLESGKKPSVFLLSDGNVTWGQHHPAELLRRHESLASLRWLCYRFGSAPVNRDLFDALVRTGGGRTVNVLTKEQLAAASRAHRTAPVVLEGVTFHGAEARDLVVAGEPKLLHAGQELQVAARLVGGGGELEAVVAASVDGQHMVWRYPVRRIADSTLAGRAWAELHVRRLLALDDERLRRMVLALSQRFGLASKAASFLILEEESDYEEFRIEDEKVNLEDLAALRAKEEDTRRDRLLGISLDDIADENVNLIRALERLDGSGPAVDGILVSLPLLHRPFAGGEERITAENTYREKRGEDDLDVKVYDAIARVRAVNGDTHGALRAYSSVVEKLPVSAEAARLVGYACLALGQYEPATELFEGVRLRRPFEPQAYLDEAVALEAAGRRGPAARNFEILLARNFPRHVDECRRVAAGIYSRFLRRRLQEMESENASRELVAGRLEKLAAAGGIAGADPALEVSIHWNTDSTDIDLWVIEPDGEKCFYGHQKTKAGGELGWDTTDGYGPELYRRGAAEQGTFGIYLHYYGNNSARWSVPTAILLRRDRESGREFRMRLLPDKDAVVSVGEETFPERSVQ